MGGAVVRIVLLALVIFFCAGCSSRVSIPPVNVSARSGDVSSGRFAAVISSGAWALRAKSDGFVCGEWSFDADLDKHFNGALRAVVERSLETIDFIDEPIPSEQLGDNGYRAQILIRQVRAEAGYSASEMLLFRDIRSRVSLVAEMTVSDRRGLAFQASLSGIGVANRKVFGCSSIAEVIGDSAHDALSNLMDEAAMHLETATRRIVPNAEASAGSISPATRSGSSD
jgi:hypothetical protein